MSHIELHKTVNVATNIFKIKQKIQKCNSRGRLIPYRQDTISILKIQEGNMIFVAIMSETKTHKQFVVNLGFKVNKVFSMIYILHLRSPLIRQELLTSIMWHL